MKKLFTCFSVVLTFLVSLPNGISQNRYMDEVFSEVKVTDGVVYGTNISILPIILGESPDPAPEELLMDVYEPVGDSLTERPVVIFAHRGDFLPPIVNLTPYGSRKDSAVVEMCNRFARMGYVAVSIDYRLGWNPFGSSIEKKSTILQAVYRITQDMRTAVRYFRKNADLDGNTFGIDTARFAVGGFDAAGFAAENVAYLKTVAQTAIPKFLDLSTSPPTPFIDDNLFGNPYGTDTRPLNLPNHAEYSSDVSAIIDFEGGLGDFEWIEPGDPPVIAFQVRSKFSLPGIRDVTEGVTSEILIADGAFPDTIIHRSQEVGNQDVFINGNLDDSLTLAALVRSGGIEGLMLYTPFRMEGQVQCDPTPGASPNTWGGNSYGWNWYDEAILAFIWDMIPNQTVPSAVYICDHNVSSGNPNDPKISRALIDTLQAYIAPRLYLAMGLGKSTSKVQSLIQEEIGFKMFPNPTNGNIHIKANEYLREVVIQNLRGQIINIHKNINQTRWSVHEDLPIGMYIVQAKFDQGVLAEKLIIHE